MQERIVTRAIIKDVDNKVLLGRRHHGSGAGQWALIGGKPDNNETPTKTICREVLEEIKVKFINPVLIEELTDSESVPGETWKVYIFKGEIEGKPEALETEITELGWFDENDIKELDIAFTHKKILVKYFADSLNKTS